MNIFLSWLTRQLSKRARPYLRSYGLLKTVKIYNKSSWVWNPGFAKVLVIAPHMDDEVIGCGGTIYKHVLEGSEVHIVFLTNGKSGSKDLLKYSGKIRETKEDELAKVRFNEAQLAVKILGIKNAVYLNGEEGNLSNNMQITDKLNRLLCSLKPDFVYLPFFLEEHPDHRAASDLLIAATKNSNLDFVCLGYEVWTPLFPNCFVEINDVLNKKKEALSYYKSQLADNNYFHTHLGLNAYRSSALLDNKDSYVEAFFAVPLNEYHKLYNICFQKNNGF